MSGARFVRANGLRFAYLSWGPSDGPLVLLLHGFPDHAPTWRHLGPVLGDAGYRVVAPWLRGYAPTEVPARSRVDLDTLAADVNALHRALGGDERAAIVGHDWGAIATYRALAAAPGRWRRYVTMAVPPEPALAGAFRAPAQLRRSWYIAAFQLPGARLLAERFALDLLDTLWERRVFGDRWTEQDVEALRSTLRSPGTMATAIGYYRELVRWMLLGRYPGGLETIPPMPGLHLHGRRDAALGAEYAEAAAALPGGPEVEILEQAGHWLHLEQPERVHRLVLDFLGAPRTAGAHTGS